MHFILLANYNFFYFGRFLKKLANDHCSLMIKGSIYHINTTFYHLSELTWNCMFYGSIYYFWYLHILPFYFVRQSYSSRKKKLKNWVLSVDKTQFLVDKSQFFKFLYQSQMNTRYYSSGISIKTIFHFNNCTKYGTIYNEYFAWLCF